MTDIRTSKLGGGIPNGINSGRPSNPEPGQLYSNGETQRIELYTSGGSWENIVQEVPGVTSISGNYSQQTNSGTIVIYGTNFVNGAIATAIGVDGTQTNAISTVFNSLVQLTATFTNLSNNNEPYDIKVTNPSNLFGILPDGLYVNSSPVWQTNAGSLGTFNEQVSVLVSATATDSDSTITYSLASGSSLPVGITLNSATGQISGTLPDIEADTTYTFTINASDGVNTIPRTFSITSLIPAPSQIEILLVAGGGGGGNIAANRGAGGGAGGLIYIPSFITSSGVYNLTIGNGGAPSVNGQNTVFSGNGRTLTAQGGGKGGDNDGTNNASAGGSGGGQWYPGYTGASATQPANTNDGITTWNGTGFGNKGGDSSSAQPYGSGGGGAGAAGGNWNSSGGPVGGIGRQYSITGTSAYYAGGGGAAGFPFQGGYGEFAGGLGGGGTGSNDSFDPISNGAANTGGGGGSGGTGGSGVLVIAYPDTFKNLTIGSGLTYDQPTRSGYKVYRITGGTGTVTF